MVRPEMDRMAAVLSAVLTKEDGEAVYRGDGHEVVGLMNEQERVVALISVKGDSLLVELSSPYTPEDAQLIGSTIRPLVKTKVIPSFFLVVRG
jgi:hypothetical protein